MRKQKENCYNFYCYDIYKKIIEEVMNQKTKQQRNNSLETTKIKVYSNVLVRIKT